MARPKAPIEKRLSEDWARIAGEIEVRLERLQKIRQAMDAFGIAHPPTEPLVRAIKALGPGGSRPRRRGAAGPRGT